MTEKATKQERFIEMRASGATYAVIAQELQVSKTTLIAWSKEFQLEIHNLSEIHRESLMEQYALCQKSRIELLSQQQAMLHKELLSRNLSDVKTKDLLSLSLRIDERVSHELTALSFREENAELASAGITVLESWRG